MVERERQRGALAAIHSTVQPFNLSTSIDARRLQFFSLALLCAWPRCAATAEVPPGKVAALVFTDVDGNRLSTTDGRVTIFTVVTRSNESEARAVAAQVPERYVGDPKYRYVTVVNFQGKLAGPLRGLTRLIIRRRLDAEAEKLKRDYTAKNLTRNPRRDVYVVADFDGGAVARLGLAPGSNDVAVFVFNGAGKLIERWSGVPPGNALAKAIAAAE